MTFGLLVHEQLPRAVPADETSVEGAQRLPLWELLHGKGSPSPNLGKGAERVFEMLLNALTLDGVHSNTLFDAV